MLASGTFGCLGLLGVCLKKGGGQTVGCGKSQRLSRRGRGVLCTRRRKILFKFRIGHAGARERDFLARRGGWRGGGCVVQGWEFCPPAWGVAEVMLGTGWGWNPSHKTPPRCVPRAERSFATYAISAGDVVTPRRGYGEGNSISARKQKNRCGKGAVQTCQASAPCDLASSCFRGNYFGSALQLRV